MLDFRMIVHEADQPVKQCQPENREIMCGASGGRTLPERTGQHARNQHSGSNADDEHKTAHRWDILLFHMPGRAVLQDFLTEFHFPQPVDDRWTDRSSHHKAERKSK